MAQSRTATIQLAAANAAAVCAAQTPAAAGPLAVNGTNAASGVAVLDVARRVLVTTAANETGKTMTVTGTDRERNPIREVLALPNAGTVFTAQDFLKVTSVVISAAAAGAITVGTSVMASTRWMRLDTMVGVFAATAAVNFAATTASVTVEVTNDQVDKQTVDREAGVMDMSFAGLPYSAFVPPAPFSAAGATAVSADTLAQISTPVRAIRLTVLSGATNGPVRLTVQQAGLV